MNFSFFHFHESGLAGVVARAGTVAPFAFDAPWVWPVCLGAAAMLLLAGIRRGYGATLVVSIILAQVGMVGLIGMVARCAPDRAVPPASGSGEGLLAVSTAPARDAGADTTLPPPNPAISTDATSPHPQSPVDTGTDPSPAPFSNPVPALRDPGDPIGALDPQPGATPNSGGPVNGDAYFPELSGNRLIFVIDISGSMGPTGRLDRVKKELLKIVASRKDGSEVGIVLFNDDFQWLGSPDGKQPRIWTKNGTTQQEVEAALSHVSAGGGTTPLPALQTALHEDPDEVCFLTDGEFDYPEADQAKLKAWNVNKARINGTIVLDGQDPPKDNAVEKITAAHRGFYIAKKEKP